MKTRSFCLVRSVKLHEIDGAGYMYFAHIASLSHEVLEAALEADRPGLYPDLIAHGKGFPCVSLQCAFRAPIQASGPIAISLLCKSLGTTSAVLQVQVHQAPETVLRNDLGAAVLCAEMHYVVVFSSLTIQADGKGQKIPWSPELLTFFGAIHQENAQ